MKRFPWIIAAAHDKRRWLEALFVAESQLLKAPPHVEKYVVTGELADVLAEQTALTKTYLNSLKSALDHLGGKVSVSRNATVEAMLLGPGPQSPIQKEIWETRHSW
jgi:ferritin-like metal-binding protein YciE